MARSTHRPGYRESLRWICLNDDTEFLFEEDPTSCSVTTALVADQFQKPVETVLENLRQMFEQIFGPIED
jgi:hypothetical protein